MRNTNYKFEIECLNSGYLLKEEGKTKAFENNRNIEEYLVSKLKTMITPLINVNIKNMVISIEVDFNTPKQSTEL
jgi:hypothetical protein